MTRTIRGRRLAAASIALASAAACVGDDPDATKGTLAPTNGDAGPNDAGGVLVDAGSTSDAATDADAAISYPETVLADAPVAYWRLGETANGTAKSSAATGAVHDLTLAGAATGELGQPSLIARDANTAIYVSPTLSATTSLGPDLKLANAFTIDGWVKLGVGTRNRTIFSTTNSGSGGFSFMIGGDTGHFFLACHAKAAYSTTSLAVPSDDQPHYIAVAWNGASSAAFYVDGATEIVSNAASVTLEYTGAVASVGNWSTGGSPLAGVLDELAIYPTTLPPARLAAHWAAGR